MDWLKRNLLFAIGSAVALVLLVAAGYYTWTGWSNKAKALEDLNQKYEELKTLANQSPHPGDRKVDNIKAAKEQTQTVQAAIGELARRFAPVPPLPEGGSNVTVQAFAATLARTIYALQREATNAGVILLQPRYEFSFQQQNRSIKLAPGSVPPLAEQLGEVKALMDVLIAAKINALEGIQRERVSVDDQAGPATDYHDHKAETNDVAVLAPYQLSFRSFTPELAAVLCGFANSAHGLIVKKVNVEPSPAIIETLTAPPMVTYVQPTPTYPTPTYPTPGFPGVPGRAGEEGGADFARRYGRALGPTPAPTPVPVAVAPAAPTGPRTILNEKQLKITMLVQVVRLLPKKT